MTDELAGYRREKLRSWWWSLSEEERAEKREQFMEMYRTDATFAAKVRKLLREEQDDG